MAPDRYEQACRLFDEVCGLEPSAQAAAIDRTCGHDAELQAEVESLLARHVQSRSSGFSPAAGQASASNSDDGQQPSTISFENDATRTLGHFELTVRLGHGAFGTVWKAHDTKLDRTVAVKIPRSSHLDKKTLKLFLHEARAAAQLKHPNIVSVHEVGETDGEVYIVSDYVEGCTLADWLTGQRLTSREAAELCAKVAAAVHHAHQSGIIHRDLKPSNILIDVDGEPHVMDFGLAKRDMAEATIAVEGSLLGTPAYMSPEQAKEETRKDRHLLVQRTVLAGPHDPIHLVRFFRRLGKPFVDVRFAVGQTDELKQNKKGQASLGSTSEKGRAKRGHPHIDSRGKVWMAPFAGPHSPPFAAPFAPLTRNPLTRQALSERAAGDEIRSKAKPGPG